MTGETTTPLINQLADVALSMHQEHSAAATVESVLGYIKTAVGAQYAGALLFGDKDAIDTVPGSDDIVEKAGAVQIEVGEGPDLTVLEEEQSILVSDIRAEPHWPHWAQAVAELGLRSLISVKLSTRDRAFGSLTVYSIHPDAFTEEDRSVVEAFARHVAIAVSTSVREQNLNAAIDSRKLIGQAQGILMERFSLSDAQAFAVLLRYSQNSNTKLRVIAERLVAERTLPSDSD